MSKKLLAYLPSHQDSLLRSSCDPLKENAKNQSLLCRTILYVEPTTSPHMEQIVIKLAAKYAVDLSQRGSSFTVNQTNHPQRWLITNLDGERIGVIRGRVGKDYQIAPDLDMVFALTPGGWEPVEIVHTPSTWQDYANAARGRPVVNAQGDFNFAAFADHYAQQLEAASQRESMRKVEGLATAVACAQNESIFHPRRNDKAIRNP